MTHIYQHGILLRTAVQELVFRAVSTRLTTLTFNRNPLVLIYGVHKNRHLVPVLNPFTTGNPFWGTKLLGFSIGRGSGALEGLAKCYHLTRVRVKLTVGLYSQEYD